MPQEMKDSIVADVASNISGISTKNGSSRWPVASTGMRKTVRQPARRIRETGEIVLLPILADALEEAGCTAKFLLDHCRQPDPDAAKSWVVELLATQE